VPFRDAHAVVGRVVRLAVEQQRNLADLTLEEMKAVSASIEKDVFDVLTPEGSVASKQVYGGASPKCVREQIVRARAKR
jgi:argininosuccinate lyase